MLLTDKLPARIETLNNRPTEVEPAAAIVSPSTARLLTQLHVALQLTPNARSVVADAPGLAMPSPYSLDKHVRVYRDGKVELLARAEDSDGYLILTTHLQAA